MSREIIELALVLTVAAGLGMVARALRQPMILAYILAGMILGITGHGPVASADIYRLFSDLGIMFLLFLIGLEINYQSLRLVGWSSLVIGLAQVGLTFVVGFFLAILFGLPLAVAGYISIALTFSSTVIVIKLLTEKGEMHSLHGKITVGLLLVQDVVAVLLLIVIAGYQHGNQVSVATIVTLLLKAIVLFVGMLWLGRSLVPRLMHRIASSPELLFLSSIAWLFLVAATVRSLGLSVEIGGFLAGLALANSAEQLQISAKVRPLRDFFLAIFFIGLGTSFAAASLAGLYAPIIGFTLFVLVGNPLIVLLIMSAMGYHRRTSFLASVNMAQVSEFSLVLAALGLSVGHLQPSHVTIITSVAILSIAISSYMISHADRLYHWLDPLLQLVQQHHVDEPAIVPARLQRRPIVMIGAHRLGRIILSFLKPKELLVIDFDPDVIRPLADQGIEAVFGDIGDEDLLQEILAMKPRLIISTSPQVEDNALLLQAVRRQRGSRPRVLVRAESDDEARRLYALHADYVIIPHLTSGQSVGQNIAADPSLRRLQTWRKNDLATLRP